MKKILCPTDFSETAHNAIAYAAKFSHATGSKLTLFNVQSMFNLSPLEMVSGKAQRVQTVTKYLEEQCLEVSRVFKISCDAEVESTASILSKVIENKGKHFDLIIMGTSQTEDWFKFFTGSNTYHAMISSATPVLLVPDKYVFRPVNQVVYACNYLIDRKLKTRQLSSWLEKLDAEVTVLQIMEAAFSQYVENELKEVQTLITLITDDINFTFDSVHQDDKPKSIHQYMQRKNADILVLATRHRNFLENFFHKSVIKSICQLASYPVLVVHE